MTLSVPNTQSWLCNFLLKTILPATSGGLFLFFLLQKRHSKYPNALLSKLSTYHFHHLTGLAGGDCTLYPSYLLPTEATLEVETWGSQVRQQQKLLPSSNKVKAWSLSALNKFYWRVAIKTLWSEFSCSRILFEIEMLWFSVLMHIIRARVSKMNQVQ